VKGLAGLSEKLTPIFRDIVVEVSKVSWVAALAMIAIGGALFMFGNEFGAKKLCKNALVGWIIIQIVAMLA